MTGVVICNNKKCACNADGDCEYMFGIELDENEKCVSFIELDEKENKENEN